MMDAGDQEVQFNISTFWPTIAKHTYKREAAPKSLFGWKLNQNYPNPFN